MMKAFIIFILAAINCFAAEFTVDQVKKEIPNIFHISVKGTGDEKYFVAEAAKLPINNILAELVGTNRFFFDYIIKNMPDYTDMNQLLSDSTMLQAEFYHRLDTNSQFTELMTFVIDGFLKSKGGKVKNYTGEKEEMLSEQLMSIAVRFFEPFRYDESGKLVSNICTNVTTFKDFTGYRNYAAEALCYQAILLEGYNRKHNLTNNYAKLINQLSLFNFSDNETTRIYRLQGALWVALYNDSSLKGTILDEYKRTQGWVPIEIVN